jgi:hypothetical protein
MPEITPCLLDCRFYSEDKREGGEEEKRKEEVCCQEPARLGFGERMSSSAM